MTSDRIPQEKVEQILRRAVDIDMARGSSVSLAQLRAIALEAGVSEEAFGQAIREFESETRGTLGHMPAGPGETGKGWLRRAGDKFAALLSGGKSLRPVALAAVSGLVLPYAADVIQPVGAVLAGAFFLAAALAVGMQRTERGLGRALVALVTFFAAVCVSVSQINRWSLPTVLFETEALGFLAASTLPGLLLYHVRLMLRERAGAVEAPGSSGGGSGSGGAGPSAAALERLVKGAGGDDTGGVVSRFLQPLERWWPWARGV